MWLHQWSLIQICLKDNNIQDVFSFLFNLLYTICIEFRWPFWWLLLCINLINRLWAWWNIVRHCETILNNKISYIVFLYVYVCIIRIRIVINTYLICVDLYVYWLWSWLFFFGISFINSTDQSPDKPMPWHCVRLCVCKQLLERYFS